VLKWTIFVIGLIVLGYVVGWQSLEPRAEVDRAWVRLPAVPGRPAAGYLTIRANGSETLLAVASPSAERIEIHNSLTENGRTRMVRLNAVETIGSRPLVLSPGQTHLMLFGLNEDLRPGQEIALTFRFRDAPPATTRARLVAAGEAEPENVGY